MFQHRHYEKIAELIKTSEASTKNEFVLELVKLFSRDNAKFSISRFLKASGINQLSLSASGKNKTVKSSLKLTNFKFTPYVEN
jgi:hypothetical protein